MARPPGKNPAPPRRRAARLEPDLRRAQILESAIRAISRTGAHTATALTVAQEAGVSEATVFKYFPDKRSLTLAVIGELGSHFQGIFDRIEAGREKAIDVLVDYAVAFTAELEREPAYTRLLLDQGAALLDPSLRQVIEANVTAMALRIEKTIRRGIAEGAIRREVDPGIAAWAYVGFYTVIAQAKVFGRPAEWIFRLQSTLLQGLIGTGVEGARVAPATARASAKGATS
ncbi:MAG: TetR/AcrR family transcriptional regulator [Myxococcota bacterium]